MPFASSSESNNTESNILVNNLPELQARRGQSATCGLLAIRYIVNNKILQKLNDYE